MKSKEELKAEEDEKRKEALAKSIDQSNRGFKMMAKLGYTAGGTLGKSEDARSTPIEIDLKEGRGGIGMDSEKRKRIREAADESIKRAKVDVEDYRQQVRGDHEERRLTNLVYAAQKTAERLDEEAKTIEQEGKEQGESATKAQSERSLKSIPVVWRGLVKQRLEAQVAKQADKSLREGMERLPNYQDTDEDAEDKWARAAPEKLSTTALMETELEEEDEELEMFQNKPVVERLEEIIDYLRTTFKYCFWCKYQYPDEEMEGCPGPTEEDHD